MGNVICCCWRMFCCECTLCEKKDDWNIDQECRPGEKAAGWLYKRAKSSAMWSKRYFAISNNKLLYYTERDRLVCKGEIVLAGALASVSTTRADTRKKFFFTISHPQCGVRELYAKTRNRRRQWIERINEISTQLMSRAVFGKLLKQGGLGKNIWQERWCICVGGTIDYFENATDNQSKGSIDIANATISPLQIKDKFCFEVYPDKSNVGGKKGNKKYVFAVLEKEHERDKWVEALKKCAQSANGDDGQILQSNPIHQSGEGANDENGAGIAMSSFSSTDKSSNPSLLAGYLMKKSPNIMTGWQKRYFQTQDNGDIKYFKSESDAQNAGNTEERGVIRLKDFIMAHPIDLNESNNEIVLHLHTKKVSLRAATTDEAIEWAQSIQLWLQMSDT